MSYINPSSDFSSTELSNLPTDLSSFNPWSNIPGTGSAWNELSGLPAAPTTPTFWSWLNSNLASVLGDFGNSFSAGLADIFGPGLNGLFGSLGISGGQSVVLQKIMTAFGLGPGIGAYTSAGPVFPGNIQQPPRETKNAAGETILTAGTLAAPGQLAVYSPGFRWSPFWGYLLALGMMSFIAIGLPGDIGIWLMGLLLLGWLVWHSAEFTSIANILAQSSGWIKGETGVQTGTQKPKKPLV